MVFQSSFMVLVGSHGCSRQFHDFLWFLVIFMSFQGSFMFLWFFKFFFMDFGWFSCFSKVVSCSYGFWLVFTVFKGVSWFS